MKNSIAGTGLISPNLPSSVVSKVIVSQEANKLSTALKNLNIETLYTDRNLLLEESISGHADMLVFHKGADVFILSAGQVRLYQNLKRIGMKPSYSRALIKSPYPHDCSLNAARLGHYLICNVKSTAKEITDTANEQELTTIDVKQGYSKCSICIINKTAIITEDKGINDACKNRGIDVLLISKGSVKLMNHDYGFFGGCTGLIDKNILAVNGNIKSHSDYKIIFEFLAKHKVEAISMSDDNLTDIGGIIPVMQKNV